MAGCGDTSEAMGRDSRNGIRVTRRDAGISCTGQRTCTHVAHHQLHFEWHQAGCSRSRSLAAARLGHQTRKTRPEQQNDTCRRDGLGGWPLRARTLNQPAAVIEPRQIEFPCRAITAAQAREASGGDAMRCTWSKGARSLSRRQVFCKYAEFHR